MGLGFRHAPAYKMKTPAYKMKTPPYKMKNRKNAK